MKNKFSERYKPKLIKYEKNFKPTHDYLENKTNEFLKNGGKIDIINRKNHTTPIESKKYLSHPDTCSSGGHTPPKPRYDYLYWEN